MSPRLQIPHGLTVDSMTAQCAAALARAGWLLDHQTDFKDAEMCGWQVLRARPDARSAPVSFYTGRTKGGSQPRRWLTLTGGYSQQALSIIQSSIPQEFQS